MIVISLQLSRTLVLISQLKTQTSPNVHPPPGRNIFLTIPYFMLYLFLTLVKTSLASLVQTILSDSEMCTHLFTSGLKMLLNTPNNIYSGKGFSV